MAGKNDSKLKKGLPHRCARRSMGKKFDKYAAYRLRVGKPRGPGEKGNKIGRNSSKGQGDKS